MRCWCDLCISNITLHACDCATSFWVSVLLCVCDVAKDEAVKSSAVPRINNKTLGHTQQPRVHTRSALFAPIYNGALARSKSRRCAESAAIHRRTHKNAFWMWWMQQQQQATMESGARVLRRIVLEATLTSWPRTAAMMAFHLNGRSSFSAKAVSLPHLYTYLRDRLLLNSVGWHGPHCYMRNGLHYIRIDVNWRW